MIIYNDRIEYATTINETKYLMTFEDYITHWNVKLSSGFKRRELSIYENKTTKSRNTFEVVKWALNTLNNFPYKGRIVIYWSDGRRRRVYGRYLIPLGYQLTRFDGNLCYYKRF